MTPQQWLAFSKYNKDRSDAEMETSKRLRENIQQLIAQSNSDLDSQKNSTEYAMRKRIHETEQAKDELMWQKKNVIGNFSYNCFFFVQCIIIYLFNKRLKAKSPNWKRTLKILKELFAKKIQY